GKNVMRGWIALDDVIALLDDVAVLQVDVFALRDQVLLWLLTLVRRLDRDPALVLVILAEPYRSPDLGDDRRFLWTPRLGQLCHPGPTAGDIARLCAFGRDTRDHVARLHVAARIDRNDRVDRKLISGFTTAGEFEDLVARLDHDRRTQVLLVSGRTCPPIDDDTLGNTCRFVELLGHRQTVDEILEGDIALDLGQDRSGVRIPLGDTLAALDLVAILDTQAGAIRDTMVRALGAVGIDDRDDHIAHHRHNLVIRVLGDVLSLELDLAIKVRLDERLLRDLRSAADVERAHGELGARLADRLRGDDAHRLAHVHRRATGEVSSVACTANTVSRFAGQPRTDLQFLNAVRGDDFDLRLGQQGTPLDQCLAARRVLNVLCRGAAKYTAGERSNHRAGIDNGAYLDAILRAAVLCG